MRAILPRKSYFSPFLPVSLVSFSLFPPPPSFSLSSSSVNWVRLGSLRSKCLSRKHPTPTSPLCCRECHNRRREGFLKEQMRSPHSLKFSTPTSLVFPPFCNTSLSRQAFWLMYCLLASFCVFLSGRWPLC